MTNEELSEKRDGFSRRTALKAGAWSVPVIAAAVSVPWAAATGDDEPEFGGWFNNAIRNQIPAKFVQPFKGYIENGSQWASNTPQSLNIHTVILLPEGVTAVSATASLDPSSQFTIGQAPSLNYQVVVDGEEVFWGTSRPGTGYQIQVNNITPTQHPVPPNQVTTVYVAVTLSTGEIVNSSFRISYDDGGYRL